MGVLLEGAVDLFTLAADYSQYLLILKVAA